MGSCGLHMIHGALRAGAEARDWRIKKIVTGAYYILHYSPAGKEEYQEVTGSNKFSLNFCCRQ